MNYPTYYILKIILEHMSQSQKTVSLNKKPVIALVLLTIIFSVGLFAVGFDQGHIFGIIIGEQAFEELYMHELFHDMRHAAGFPCH